ncbi:hypothetical protein PybrP1_005577 [[Pythium] brassicae (nom. inval.)]|nr:hypothetical protein PybrP1_005577 [[Pythium] brassicae (nom. inval.)]
MRIGVKQYATVVVASMGSLFAGSSFMHAVLKPDLTIPDYTRDADGNEKRE